MCCSIDNVCHTLSIVVVYGSCRGESCRNSEETVYIVTIIFVQNTMHFATFAKMGCQMHPIERL